MKTKNLGWAVAGVLGLSMAGMVGAGFQTPSQKIGTVNMAKVFNDSEFVKKQDSDLKNLATERRGTAEFLEAYRIMPTADLEKFKNLSTKPTKSDADKAEIERLRSAAVQADQKYRDLQTKANKTEAETTQLAEFNRRIQENTGLLQRVQDELGQELQDRQNKLQLEAMERAKAAIQEVSKKEGYTVVFADQYAPYSANDVTAEALKAMNAKK
ncbi:OmpH family outer membrane protein [bacterium]|nr:MAG: OmpH family outer membrane protein [bacterium]